MVVRVQVKEKWDEARDTAMEETLSGLGGWERLLGVWLGDLWVMMACGHMGGAALPSRGAGKWHGALPGRSLFIGMKQVHLGFWPFLRETGWSG